MRFSPLVLQADARGFYNYLLIRSIGFQLQALRLLAGRGGGEAPPMIQLLSRLLPCTTLWDACENLPSMISDDCSQIGLKP